VRLALALVAVPALAHAEPQGLAIGAEVGEPASLTAAWFTHPIDVALAVGSGTLAGPGFQAHVDVQLIALKLAPDVPLRVGLGARVYDQHYQLMSRDELPDWHLGARASAALAYEHGSMQVYAELAPGVDLWRSPSCSLADGAMSICPHAMSKPVFLDFVIGAHWFLSH
jgi:hypothetical protein